MVWNTFTSLCYKEYTWMGKESRIVLLRTVKGSADSLPWIPWTRHPTAFLPISSKVWKLHWLHLHHPNSTWTAIAAVLFSCGKVAVALIRPDGSGREQQQRRVPSWKCACCPPPSSGRDFSCRLPISGISQVLLWRFILALRVNHVRRSHFNSCAFRSNYIFKWLNKSVRKHI